MKLQFPRDNYRVFGVADFHYNRVNYDGYARDYRYCKSAKKRLSSPVTFYWLGVF